MSACDRKPTNVLRWWMPHRLVRGKSQNAHSSGIPALRRPSIIRSYIARKSGLACGAIVALSAAIDTLARFGGDEFALLMADVGDPTDAGYWRTSFCNA